MNNTKTQKKTIKEATRVHFEKTGDINEYFMQGWAQ